MRRMYSKWQIKSLGKGYRHEVMINAKYVFYVTCGIPQFKTVKDIPFGFYIGYSATGEANIGAMQVTQDGNLRWFYPDDIKDVDVISFTDAPMD